MTLWYSHYPRLFAKKSLAKLNCDTGCIISAWKIHGYMIKTMVINVDIEGNIWTERNTLDMEN